MGWHRFIDGFLMASWLDTQQSYLAFIGGKTTSKRWASRLITKLWETAWDMWRHRMKIINSPDSQTLLALSTDLDVKIQACFTRFQDQPILEMQRSFSQPAHIMALETLDFKQQWIEMVDSVWAFHD
jgi:hypothetical protein